MNAFDVAVTILGVAGLVFGLIKGLARIAIGLVSMILAFLVATRFEGSVASWLESLKVSPTPARIAAYLIIFVVTIVLGGVAAWLVGKILKLTMLSWADRTAGGALGILAAVVAAALIIHPIAAAAPGGSRTLRTSRLAPYVSVVTDVMNIGAPKELAGRYDKGVASLRSFWRGEVKPEIDRALAPVRR